MDTIDCPKCEHEHKPRGSHGDDSGERNCEACGFAFVVEIEYDPSYHTSCIECEWGGPETIWDRMGNPHRVVRCLHCQCVEVCDQKQGE